MPYIFSVDVVSFSLCPKRAACGPTGSTQLNSPQLNSTQLNSSQLNSTPSFCEHKQSELHAKIGGRFLSHADQSKYIAFFLGAYSKHNCNRFSPVDDPHFFVSSAAGRRAPTFRDVCEHGRRGNLRTHRPNKKSSCHCQTIEAPYLEWKQPGKK